MIEPLERTLQRHERAAPTGAIAPAGGSVLTLPSGEIAGELRQVGGARRRDVRYELLVSNDTPIPLATFAYAVSETGPSTRINCSAVVVPPYSAMALELETKLPRKGRAPRIVAELHAKEARLRFDSSPASDPRRASTWKPLLFATTTLLLAAGLTSAIQMRPRVVALAAPDAIRGGVLFSIAYALAGSGDAGYVVETPDGLQVLRGDLPRNGGAFTLALPMSNVSSGYDIRVDAHGPLGNDSRTTHIVALPIVPVAVPSAPPQKQRSQPSPARIAALTLAQDRVYGGEPIVVDYRTAARTGTVRLIDQQGTVRAEALLNRGGHSILVAPEVGVDQDMRVVVSAELGSARDESATAVRVFRVDPQTNPSIAAGSASQVSTGSDGSAPIAVDPVSAAGVPIVIRILRHEPALRVALVDAAGIELAARDVPPDAPFVTLAPAAGRTAAQVHVVVSFARGYGQETLIRPVTLRARTDP